MLATDNLPCTVQPKLILGSVCSGHQGVMLQSGVLEAKETGHRSALKARHVLNPKGSDAQMTLHARAGACIVKLEWVSIERILDFLQGALLLELFVMQMCSVALVVFIRYGGLLIYGYPV